MWNYNFFLYITTNPSKTTLYVGITNDLHRRLQEHEANKGKPETFAGRYYCHWLVYYERHTNIEHAIAREGDQEMASRGEDGLDTIYQSRTTLFE